MTIRKEFKKIGKQDKEPQIFYEIFKGKAIKQREFHYFYGYAKGGEYFLGGGHDDDF